MDVVANADGAGEADEGLEGRGAGNVGAFGHESWMTRGFDSESGAANFSILTNRELVELAVRECGRNWFPRRGRPISLAGKVYRARLRFRFRVSRVFRGPGLVLPAVPPW